jgi:Ca2+-binding RTX toxin-like protein
MAIRTIFHGRPDFDPDQTFFNAINEGLSAVDETTIAYGSDQGNFVTFTGTIDVAPVGAAIGPVIGGTVTGFRIIVGDAKTPLMEEASGYSISATALVSALEDYKNGHVDAFEALMNVPTKWVGSPDDDFIFDTEQDGKLHGAGGDDEMYGAGGDDALFGGIGNDFLSGRLGHDKLTGGPGLDQFVFDHTLSADDLDRITDFTRHEDKILLDQNFFASIGPLGTLARDAFHKGHAAADGEDRIIYNADNGKIYFDEDGSGSHFHKIAIARVDPGQHLGHGDFVVFLEA